MLHVLKSIFAGLFLNSTPTSRYGHTNSGFDILLESVIGQFYKESDIEEVNKFFNNKDDLGSVERGVKKGIVTFYFLFWFVQSASTQA